MEEIKKDNKFGELYESFSSEENKTDNFYFFPKDEDLEDQDDMIPILPQQFKNFIEKAPHAITLEEYVKEVKVDQFEEIKEKYDKQINLLKEEKVRVLQDLILKMEKEREEIRKRFKEEQLYQEKMKKMLKTLENDRIEREKRIFKTIEFDN